MPSAAASKDGSCQRGDADYDGGGPAGEDMLRGTSTETRNFALGNSIGRPIRGSKHNVNLLNHADLIEFFDQPKLPRSEV